MLIKYSDLTNAVDSVKAVLSDNKSEQVNILLRFEAAENVTLVAYSDGRKAVVKKVETEFFDGEAVDRDVIVAFKQLNDIMEMAKPVGSLQVNDIEIITEVDKKQLNFKVEKFVYLDAENEGEEAEKKVIAVLKQSFKYISPEDDRRQKALLSPNYSEMLGENILDDVEGEEENANAADVWGRAELIKVISKVSAEDDKQIIMSARNNTVSVSNLNYTVWLPREEVQNALCLTVKMAKNISEVFKRALNSEEVHVSTKEGFCTVRDSEGTVAFWFESEKPLRKTLNVIEGYTGLAYDKFSLVVMKDAAANIVKCCGDVKDIALEFKGDAINGFKVKVGGNDSAIKSNDFELDTAEVVGDTEELVKTTFKVNTETFKAMLDLCDSVYVKVDFNVDDAGVAVVRVSDVSKTGGIVVRNMDCFTPVVYSVRS